MSSPTKDALCRVLRQTLTTEGREALRDDEVAQEHLADCPDCLAFLEAQAELEVLLPQLPAIDAPDELVAQVLRSVEQERSQPEGSERETSEPLGFWRRNFPWAETWLPHLAHHQRSLALGATFVLAVIVGLAVLSPSLRKYQVGEPEVGQEVSSQAFPADEEVTEEQRQKLRSLGYVDGDGAEKNAALQNVTAPKGGTDAGAFDNRVEVTAEVPVSSGGISAEFGSDRSKQNRIARENESDEILLNLPDGPVPAAPAPVEKILRDDKEWAKKPGEAGRRESTVDDWSVLEAEVLPRKVTVSDRIAGNQFSGSITSYYDSYAPRRQAERKAQQKAGKDKKDVALGAGSGLYFFETDPAQDFLNERNRVEGLVFQDADGYWANGYVPGDPVFRLLQTRLEGAPVVAHEDARQAFQPFDPPTNSALAVYIQADRRSLDGETRTLVQVGLQGTERRGGRRSALSLAVVLDLTDLSVGGEASMAAAALRALVLALGEKREAGDRFHLVVAGRPGGALLEPEHFRHGRLLVALDQLFGVGGGTAETLDLPAAVAVAVRRVHQGDDPNAPLGSNVVLLATPRILGAATAGIASLAHQGAVEGVLLSTIGVGAGIDRRELDRIALAGQGSRRLMTHGSEAAKLVERELASASRAVARAVRVRIRLAPGVRLVDVVGSRRLDALQAEEVREAERGVDLQLAQRMSIEADRGEDEEGIQMVLPSFYAGDSHVILLDVVAPGPGAVADVTVRYKDLVYLRNGVARDQLSLPRGQEAAGPLELNVLKNLIAYRLFQTLEGAGKLAATGELEAAGQRLAGFTSLLLGFRLQTQVPGLAQDRDLAGDLNLLEHYRGLLGSDGGTSSVDLQTLVDSLRLAARLKILPQPIPKDE